MSRLGFWLSISWLFSWLFGKLCELKLVLFLICAFMNSNTQEIKPLKKWRFSLRSAFVLMGVLAVLFAAAHYLSIGIGNAREVAQRKRITNNFKHVLIGFRNFDDTFTKLPRPTCYEPTANKYEPNLKPLYSWRFAILPFLQSSSKEMFLDLSWDAPENLRFLNDGVPYTLENWQTIATDTRVFAITGPNTVFGDGQYELPASLDDAPADTILIVEVRDSDLNWMAPGDFDIRTMPESINAPDGKGISGIGRDGFHIGFVDGRAWCLSNETPFTELKKFFTMASAEQFDADDILGPYRID